MSVTVTRDKLRTIYQSFGDELYRSGQNQLHFLVHNDQQLEALCRHLSDDDFYLVTVVANDERELEDYCFKLYYLFSHPTADIFLIVENPLAPDEETFTSIYEFFAGVDPFEQEIADLLGLLPHNSRGRVKSGNWLHNDVYPPNIHPLRRDQTAEALKIAIEAYSRRSAESRHDSNSQRPPGGEWLLPVGPIHAGVIEPGQFLFRLAGELVEELSIQLGYTHKGIERLFQVGWTLADGWQLAEHISGDSSFAHSMAYCQAAEALAGVSIPREAIVLRNLCLELERIANHIGDCGALAHDVALDVVASEMAALREQILRLNLRITGHRWLRGLNRPGGIVLSHPLTAGEVDETQEAVAHITQEFVTLAYSLQQMPGFRERTIRTGILTAKQATRLGITGLPARASGVDRDFRWQHSCGIYEETVFRESVRNVNTTREETAGDVFARFLVRLNEVRVSAVIIEHVLARWKEIATRRISFITPIDFSRVSNYEFGLGYVEGWRGDIVYWLMKDKFEGIYRCKVRDPSMLNWPALKAAVDPHELDDDYIDRHKLPTGRVETIIADFPVINKSFNLSYSGNDL